jgi:hypothetical protein
MANNRFGVRVVCGVGVLVLACGGKSLRQRDGASDEPGAGSAGEFALGGSSSGGSSPGAGASGDAPEGCSVSLDGRVDVSVTPRADPFLELMALKFSSSFVADQAIYDRFVRDVKAIREIEPALLNVGYFAPDDGHTLMLGVEPSTLARMRTGEYHDWDCLNRALVVTSTEFAEGALVPYAQLTLKGIYNLKQLATKYAALEGVKSAEPSFSGGDGPTICVTREGPTWHYVFDEAYGDCTAGCIEHLFLHFSTDASGTVNALGIPSAAERAAYANDEACR